MVMGTDVTDAPLDASLADLLEADLPTRIAALEALGGAIASADIQDERDRYSGPELGRASVRVHKLCARLTGKRYEWLTVEEADGRWAASAFHPRTFSSHIAHTHGISYANANRTVRLARQLREAIPRFGAALRAGRIGPDHIDALASTALTSPTRIAALAELVEDDGGPDDEDAGPADDGSQNSETADTQEHPDGSGDTSRTVEDYLLEQARGFTVNQVRRLGRHFAQMADPEADERGYREAKQREYVELVRTLDGWHLSGFLTEENGRLIRTAMDALMTPPAPDDDRTPEQRRAQALADVAHLVLDQGLLGTHASVRPHLGVLIGPTDFDQLLRNAQEPALPPQGQPAPSGRPDRSGRQEPSSGPDSSAPEQSGVDRDRRPARPSWETEALANLAGINWAAGLRSRGPTFDDGTGPVPPALLRRLATCGGLYRVLFSPDGEVINHGRERRLFTPAQRRALVARDKGCTWPGCTAPPVICESHHARIHWSDGGPTDTANGALLCYHHHATVDARGIIMTHQDGQWFFTLTDGTIVNTDIHPPAERFIWPGVG